MCFRAMFFCGFSLDQPQHSKLGLSLLCVCVCDQHSAIATVVLSMLWWPISSMVAGCRIICNEHRRWRSLFPGRAAHFLSQAYSLFLFTILGDTWFFNLLIYGIIILIVSLGCLIFTGCDSWELMALWSKTDVRRFPFSNKTFLWTKLKPTKKEGSAVPLFSCRLHLCKENISAHRLVVWVICSTRT